MKAGRLRHWLRLEKPVITQDAFGGKVTTWTFVADVPAAIDALSGREYFAADREVAGLTWRITIRETPGFTIEPNWRGISLDDDADRIFDFIELLPSHERAVITIAATCGQSQP